jgi:molecular chaperone HscB
MKAPQFHNTGRAEAGPDYYALLGLGERFAIDSAELERCYLERSRQVHPDRFVNAPASERVWALQASMQLNDAYRTLKKPMARAEYLLRRHGVTIGDSEPLDPEFLMDILEQREQLAEAKLAGDRARLRAFATAMEDRWEEALGRVAALFAGFEADGDREGLADIKVQVILLRYFRRYLDELDEMEDREL